MKSSSEFLEGVDVNPNTTIIYPINDVLNGIEELLGMTINELKETELFQEILDTSVTRCPNVYASRSQNAFLTINRKRYIANFEKGYITDIDRDSNMKIDSNAMIDGTRYIGIEGIMIPNSIKYK